jgi:hypothetical protein
MLPGADFPRAVGRWLIMTDKLFALDWAKWRRHRRFSDAARKGFDKRPFPARSWAALLPAGQMPWPYSADEARTVANAFPEQFREAGLEKAVQAARLWIRQQTPLRGKSNPRTEILRLRGALVCMFEALMNMGPDAQQHLKASMRVLRLPGQEPFTVEQLRYALDRFDHENRIGLNRLPTPIKSGPRIRHDEVRLFLELQNAFKGGHGGVRPTRGWPAFLSACLTPLKDFGMPPRSEKSWQDTLRKRRKIPAKKR